MKLTNDQEKILGTTLAKIAKRFDVNYPTDDMPKELKGYIAENKEAEEEISLELQEQDYLEVMDWAAEKAGVELDEDYLPANSELSTLATLVANYVFSMNYENGNIKKQILYYENAKNVGRKARLELNKQTEKLKKTSEVGLVYAKHFGIEEEYEKLNLWEKMLFVVLCKENNPKYTKMGKN